MRQVHSSRSHHPGKSHHHFHEHLHLVLRLFLLTLEVLDSSLFALELVDVEVGVALLDALESTSRCLDILEADVAHSCRLETVLALFLDDLERLDLTEHRELGLQSLLVPVLRNELDVDVVLLPLLLEELEVTELLDLAD